MQDAEGFWIIHDLLMSKIKLYIMNLQQEVLIRAPSKNGVSLSICDTKIANHPLH